jgi:hypothetical protein
MKHMGGGGGFFIYYKSYSFIYYNNNGTIKFYSFIYYKIYFWHSGGRFSFFQRIQSVSGKGGSCPLRSSVTLHVADSVYRLRSSGLNTRLTFSSATSDSDHRSSAVATAAAFRSSHCQASSPGPSPSLHCSYLRTFPQGCCRRTC